MNDRKSVFRMTAIPLLVVAVTVVAGLMTDSLTVGVVCFAALVGTIAWFLWSWLQMHRSGNK